MIRLLLDTDICIYVLKGREPRLEEKFDENANALAVSDVTLFELAYGASRYANPQSRIDIIEGFAARLQVLPFDTNAALHAADIRARLKMRGTPIGNYDLLIAGIARSRGLRLVTRNIREFSRVEGLLLEDWAAASL